MILTTSTGRFAHDVASLLVSYCANKSIAYNFYTRVAVMIGWLIGNIIWWVGIIVIIMWFVQMCSV